MAFATISAVIRLFEAHILNENADALAQARCASEQVWLSWSRLEPVSQRRQHATVPQASRRGSQLVLDNHDVEDLFYGLRLQLQVRTELA